MASRRVISQRDIAARAGVSQSAVSIVLNGRSEEMGIPLHTQERIQRVMEELKYVPNVAARALRNGRNNLLGVYTFERVFPVNPSDYYNEFLNGVEEEAVNLGVDLVLFTSALHAGEGTGGVYRAGSNRLGIADGTVVLGSKKSDDELARLSSEGYPFVFIGRRDVPGVVVPCVTADYYNAMSAVVDLVASFEHFRVGYVGSTLRTQPLEERLNGFRHFAQAHKDLYVNEEFTTAELVTAKSLQQWMESGCTAIVAETADLGAAILQVAQSSDIKIPGDLSLIVLDVGVESPNGVVSHLGIPRRAMGRKAVSLLVELIQTGTVVTPAVMLKCSPPTSETVSLPAPVRSTSPLVPR